MRFYLSSYRLCSSPLKFTSMFSKRKRVAIIMNALDFSDDAEWIKGRQLRETEDLRAIGLESELLDLRSFFGKTAELEHELSRFDGFWVVGGNAFVLRKAMEHSGFDRLLLSKLNSKYLVYGGYSAGVCVLCPTLDGIHLVDRPDVIPSGYHGEPIWEGLGILKYCVAPHYASEHHESHLIDEAIQYFIDNKRLFIALKDGESLSCEILAL
ncbi:MAG TPA: Type 1 glutamine amidotransferase-like domain-containing protein [Oligoflexus sp.]|uniref:Type 1 glutamine amidotransferase-like domain-containing protein n=1 Tax=Oligoflexus sp. TaxID=1971216 RepID=UPI002D7F398C|nr:Type 1 glutamine amidotransferase-like domain-containing protein [Oligoflexus sp.]HET9236542.1 Type 1 glutamine amidotransferase-like domain-containing protein [Oligoflexus sp.]